MHYEGKDRPKPGYTILDTTPYSRSANLNSGGPGHQRTFLVYRRAAEPQGHNALGVTDICLIMPSKGESTPHTFCRVDKNLNTSMVGAGCGTPRLYFPRWDAVRAHLPRSLLAVGPSLVPVL